MIKSILPLVALLFLSSCATMFNSRKQNITINTQRPNASVHVDGTFVGKGENITTVVKKDAQAKSIKITEEGYKDTHVAVIASQRPIIYWLNVLSIPWFGVGFWGDMGKGAFDYTRDPISATKKTPVVRKKDGQKYIYLTKSSFDVPKEKLNFNSITYKAYRKDNQAKSSSMYNYTSKEKLTIDNTIFSDDMNEILKKNGFIDTTGTLLKSQTNTLYIKVTVDSLTIKQVANAFQGSFLVSELGLTWEIQDIYQQTKFKYKTTSISDEYVNNYSFYTSSSSDKSDEPKPEKLSLSDALQKSFYELLAKNEVQELLVVSAKVEEKFETLKMTTPTNKVTDLATGIKATVTVVTDEGHGSGFCISNDGYIVTNFHVVANSKKITINLNNGKKAEAKVVRKSEEADLALLKMEEQSDFAFVIPTELNFQIGDETYAIGTPKSVELGQTLTKGIISGKRKKDTQEVIQTDVSINSGNSGGALVTKDGKLVGVVNAKLMGFGVEGIAFGIIAKDIIQHLKLSY